jgi:hypothetical protein
VKRFNPASLLTGSWWLGPVVAGWALLMFSSAPDRGFDQFGIWQLEQTQSAHDWLSGGAVADGMSQSEAVRMGLSVETRRGPLIGLLPAAAWQLSGDAGNVVEINRLTNTLLICLTAWLLFYLAQRAGGPLAGLASAVSLIAVPRVWAAATSPGGTAIALFAITAAAIALERGRDRLRWAIPAVAMVVFAVLSTQIALMLLLIWVFLTFFEGKPADSQGLLAARPLTPWGPLIFPLALVILALALPVFRDEGFSGLGDFATAFLEAPREQTLYLGHLYGSERLPWHAAIMLTALTIPPTVLFLTCFGIVIASPLTSWLRRRLAPSAGVSRDPRAGEPLRLTWAMLLLTLSVPLLLGTSHSHGVDLLALIVPWCAIYAGVGLQRVMEVAAVRLHNVFAGRTWARLGMLALLTTLGWGIFVFALKDAEEVYPEVESYYSWLVGGVDGAAEIGLPRYPHGPPPAHFLRSLIDDDAEAGLAVIAGQGPSWAIIDWYRAHGLVPAGLYPAPLQNADIVIIQFNELAPEFYRQLPAFYSAVGSVDDGSVRWLQREGLPLFGAVRLAP